MNEWMKLQWIERVPTLRSRWMGGLIFGGFWPLCRHHINFQGIWLIFYSQLMGQWYANNMQIRCKVAKNQKKKKMFNCGNLSARWVEIARCRTAATASEIQIRVQFISWVVFVCLNCYAASLRVAESIHNQWILLDCNALLLGLY